MLEDQLTQDLKKALLAGDSLEVNTLRSLKSAILYAKVASGSRDVAMTPDALLAVLQKEAKKRQESVEAYRQAGNEEKAAAEQREKEIIERYLPAKLSDDAVATLVEAAIADLGGPSQAQMGAVISQVRQRAAGAADGAVIARLTKERLGK